MTPTNPNDPLVTPELATRLIGPETESPLSGSCGPFRADHRPSRATSLLSDLVKSNRESFRLFESNIRVRMMEWGVSDGKATMATTFVPLGETLLEMMSGIEHCQVE